MEKKYVLELLGKYERGEATYEEQKLLTAYFNLFENKPDILASLNDDQRLALQEDIRESIWDTIGKAETEQNNAKIKMRRFQRFAVAAMFILACIVGVMLSTKISDKQIPSMMSVKNDRNIERQIKLPDGSTVILGSYSRIDYAVAFNTTNKRSVYLSGNAFFDVVHKSSKPFVVHSDKVQTVVLGTAFTVEAFPWDKEITVTVKRGKVSVSDEVHLQGIITPDQQIKYNKNERSSTRQKVDAIHYDKWKSSSLLFTHITLAEAAELLEKKFKVRILFSNKKVKSARFTATFNANEPLENILKSICEFNDVAYTYDKNKALIYIKPIINQ